MNRRCTISALDHEGRGVAHCDGKALFIENALPGETVEYIPRRVKPNYEIGMAAEIFSASPFRTTPRCRYFGVCGGCSLQHIDADAQLIFKQRVLEEQLARIGKVKPDLLLSPVYGQAWDYRYRARLSVRHVAKKGGVLVGFHERRSTFVADMSHCEVLPDPVAGLIQPLRELIGALSISRKIPQLEVALSEQVLVLVLRNLEPLSVTDQSACEAFAARHGVHLYLQPQGPRSAAPFFPRHEAPLEYSLPEFDVVMPFRPTEFTQVNPAMNRVLVRRALALLDPQPGERVLDLFCGLGNFSLPIARRGANVLGIEGESALVERARENAMLNRIDSARFERADLFKLASEQFLAWGQFDKWLIDPPRDGAIEVVKAMPADGPRRIVYVSCNPATLARDAAVLVHGRGYRLRAAGVLNMFPHTSHVESMALFEQENGDKKRTAEAVLSDCA